MYIVSFEEIQDRIKKGLPHSAGSRYKLFHTDIKILVANYKELSVCRVVKVLSRESLDEKFPYKDIRRCRISTEVALSETFTQSGFVGVLVRDSQRGVMQCITGQLVPENSYWNTPKH